MSSHGTRNTPTTPRLCIVSETRKKPRLCVKSTAQPTTATLHPYAPEITPHGEIKNGEPENTAMEEHTAQTLHQSAHAELQALRQSLTPATPPAARRTTHTVAL